jgi:hypothetical protein
VVTTEAKPVEDVLLHKEVALVKIFPPIHKPKKKNNPGGEKPRMTYYEVWEF